MFTGRRGLSLSKANIAAFDGLRTRSALESDPRGGCRGLSLSKANIAPFDGFRTGNALIDPMLALRRAQGRKRA